MDIFTALAKGNTKLLQDLLIQNNHDVNITDCNGQSALMYAVMCNSLPMVQLILRWRPDITRRDQLHGRTVLHWCGIHGNMNICVEIMRYCKALDFELPDDSGYTCMHHASERGHFQLLSYILEHFIIDVNGMTTGTRHTCLHLAVKNGHKKTVCLLLKCGRISLDRRTGDEGENTALILAARHNRCAIVRHLLKAHADQTKTNTDGETALFCASLLGHIQAVRMLLSYAKQVKQLPRRTTKQHNFGACCMLPTKCPLTAAAVNGHAAIVRELLNEDLLIDFCTAFLYAARLGHVGVVKSFVAYRKRLEYRGEMKLAGLPPTWQRALFPAAIQGHHKVVKLLMTTNCNINSVYPLNRTVLHDVTREGHLKVIKILVRRGASIQTKDSAGISPFLESVRSALTCSSVFQYYMKRLSPADLELNLKDKDHKNDSGLHLAAVHGNMEVINVLLHYITDCNDTNWLDRTPLHIAAKHSRCDAVSILLDHGARVDVYDKGRNTPLTLHLVSCVLGKQHTHNPLPHLRVIHALLNFSARTDEFSFFTGFVLTPLQAAIKNRMKDAFLLLLHHGADLTQLWHSNFSHHLPFANPSSRSAEEGQWSQFVQQTLCLPFTLQTVCRRKIRSCLHGSKPDLVCQLGLPLKLQSYILLKDFSFLQVAY